MPKSFFVTCILALAPSLAVHASPLTTNYEAERITDSVYVIHGPLGYPTPENQGFMNNPGFVLTTAGVVVIDPGSSRWVGDMVLEKIGQITDQPVVAVFNTHVHGDHWLGNQAVKESYPDVSIYGHPRMLERVAQGAGEQWVEMMDSLTNGATKGTRPLGPDRKVENAESVSIGGTRFQILHTGKAHTDNDIMIHVVQEETIFLGDNVAYQRILRMDDGSFQGNVDAVSAAIAVQAKHYVPGHGRTGGAEVAEAYREYLSALNAEVRKYYEEGLSDFEIKPLVAPALTRWHAWSGYEEELGKHVSLNYLEIEAEEF